MHYFQAGRSETDCDELMQCRWVENYYGSFQVIISRVNENHNFFSVITQVHKLCTLKEIEAIVNVIYTNTQSSG